MIAEPRPVAKSSRTPNSWRLSEVTTVGTGATPGLARKNGSKPVSRLGVAGWTGRSIAAVFHSPTGPSGVTSAQTSRAHCIANIDSRMSSSSE